MFSLQFVYPHQRLSQDSFLKNTSEVWSRASSCTKKSHPCSRNNSTINFNLKQVPLEFKTHLRNNSSQFQISSQLRDYENRISLNSAHLQMIPKFLDEKNMSKYVGNSRQIERKSHGINIVSNENEGRKEKENDAWIL